MAGPQALVAVQGSSDEFRPAARPVAFSLAQNSPNPFNPTTKIHFVLPARAHVELTLFDVHGRPVQRVLDVDAPAGTHTVILDARNLVSGIYFYKLTTGTNAAIRKMIVTK